MEHCNSPRCIVVTGGPGAGKTALLELIRVHQPKRIRVLPEAASLLFRGGFPRRGDAVGRACAQRAIFHVQDSLERLALSDDETEILLCDRGTLDGLAYWPHSQEQYFAQLHTTMEQELSRYFAVIHLRTPSLANGYDHSNPYRIESAREAANIDEEILRIWSQHPNRFIVPSTDSYIDKERRALEILDGLLGS